MRFRCRTGHAYTAAALDDEMSEATETALWTALRALEEKVALVRRVAARAPGPLPERYHEQARVYGAHVQTLHDLLRRLCTDGSPRQNRAINE